MGYRTFFPTEWIPVFKMNGAIWPMPTSDQSCIQNPKLGVYALSAIIVDRAEPAEALKASVCWSMGLPDAQVLVSSGQIPAFLRGEDVAQETDKKGVAGAYLLNDRFELPSKECKEWHLCLDGQKSQPQIMDLVRRIQSDVQGLKKDVEEDLLNDGIELKKIVAKADGLQQTADKLCVARHYANVLFNVMRGGYSRRTTGSRPRTGPSTSTR